MNRVLIVALLTSTMAAAQDAPRSPVEIAKLIELLDHKQFAERDRASRKLVQLEEVPPALEAAIHSPSAETARRAAAIIRSLLSLRLGMSPIIHSC